MLRYGNRPTLSLDLAFGRSTPFFVARNVSQPLATFTRVAAKFLPKHGIPRTIDFWSIFTCWEAEGRIRCHDCRAGVPLSSLRHRSYQYDVTLFCLRRTNARRRNISTSSLLLEWDEIFKSISANPDRYNTGTCTR